MSERKAELESIPYDSLKTSIKTSKSMVGKSDNKKSRSTACCLCQKRKQKCDHRYPSCTICIKAGAECIKPVRYGLKTPVKDEYTCFLEKKIQHLERLLDINLDSNDNTKLRQKNQSLKNYKKVTSYITTDYEQQPALTPKTTIFTSNNSSSIKIPIPLDYNINDGYLHTSTCNLTSGKDQVNANKVINHNQSFIEKYNLKDFISNEPVYQIEEKYSRQFLQIYFSRYHYKIPLLDEDIMYTFHNSFFNNTINCFEDNNDLFNILSSKMWLVFAIAANMQMTIGHYSGPLPERFFATALRYIMKCEKIDDMNKIEILSLLVVYLMRTDKDSVEVYEIIGDAMQICKKLKLHKTITTIHEKDRKLKDKKLRTFWSVYLLEKPIAIAVSKPYVLPESLCDKDLLLFAYEPSKANHPIDGPIFINQIIKIRRIEAEFVEKLGILNINSDVTKNQLPMVQYYFDKLDKWRQDCQGFSNGMENETLSLYYYRSIRLLIQPYLELLDAENRLFKECQAAAGQICQCFKNFHEKTVYGHSTIHIHAVFVAGVTLIYCLWLRRNQDDMHRKQLGDHAKHTRPIVSEALFSGLNDLSACSVSLFVMAERTKFALSFRDTFDELMSVTIGNLILRCGPDSSEIVYKNGPDMPPAIVRKRINHISIDSLLNFKKTEAEKVEDAERKRVAGQLRCAIPRRLSHLFAHSPLIPPQEYTTQTDSQQTNSQNRTIAPIIQSTSVAIFKEKAIYPFTNKFALPLQQPLTLVHSSPFIPLQLAKFPQIIPASVEDSTQLPLTEEIGGEESTSFNSEKAPFNGRTTTMINNISTWTGESGQQIHPGLMNFSINEFEDFFNNNISDYYEFLP
ncbi:hypothetical protein PACTADRAFT_50529 [Pachysolen tannophilus NRRL Y-2460]|uniref:Zn(2)-C6 fungal-type domain-containing protein n=1 Tax=Pachysolen tannophilus NRRL Y-2460 TaxID=669874 RepID=A0A1E4TSF1_PACTA|nr:hypothetical protein PACTADRAFT_50529 [Pachysolen tannophilus NRRL Y-2460]